MYGITLAIVHPLHTQHFQASHGLLTTWYFGDPYTSEEITTHTSPTTPTIERRTTYANTTSSHEWREVFTFSSGWEAFPGITCVVLDKVEIPWGCNSSFLKVFCIHDQSQWHWSWWGRVLCPAIRVIHINSRLELTRGNSDTIEFWDTRIETRTERCFALIQ